MKSRNLVVDYVQYLGLRVFAMIAHMFPIDTNLATARLMGRVWYHSAKVPLLRRLLARGRLRALENLEYAYPEWTPQQREQVALRSMQQMAMLAMEILFTPRLITPSTWHRYVRLGNVREALGLLLRGRGLILVTGHFGSWEMLGYTLATIGFDMDALFRPLDNPFLNRYLVETREHHGVRLLVKKGATASMDEILDAGGTLAFIADQDAGRKGIFVDFFGRQASTYKSIALVARQHRVPIIVGYARRTDFRHFHYKIGIQEIIYPQQWEGADDEVLWITQRFTRSLEEAVRQAPDQYLWVHRRWKHRPKDELPAAAPAELTQVE